jgi:hypothetical protein
LHIPAVLEAREVPGELEVEETGNDLCDRDPGAGRDLVDRQGLALGDP